jgi:hypothetical protein
VTPVQGSLPTLTEVIEVVADGGGIATPLPLAPDSVPLEAVAPAAPVAAREGDGEQALLLAVIERLQPQLEAMIQARLAAALAPNLKAEIDAASRSLAHELRADLPALVREALDEVRRQAAAR